jgi:hypothetical protein
MESQEILASENEASFKVVFLKPEAEQARVAGPCVLTDGQEPSEKKSPPGFV